MSLKAFHVLFVTVCVVLALGFGVWAVYDYKKTGEVGSLIVGVVSVLIGFALIAYGRWFLRKNKGVGYL